MACNSKSDPEEEEENVAVVNVANVAVTSFSLKSNSKVAAHLDSVFFSIDLEQGVIYNADSLPKGTKIDKLVPEIKYSDFIASAVIKVVNDSTTTYDYYQHPNDTIDFRGDVTLSLATHNDDMKKDYRIKINIHQQDPDSLVWEEMAVTGLPSRQPNPVSMGMATLKDKVYCFILESAGVYTVSTTDNLYSGIWNKTPYNVNTIYRTETFTASSDSLYILDRDNHHFSSVDGLNWNFTGRTWISILGGYENSVLGLEETPDGIFYSQYPLAGLTSSPIATDFPLSGTSQLGTISTPWSQNPIAIMAGGVTSDGPTSSVWGFDGTSWARLSSGNLPNIEGATLVPYYAYRNLSSNIRPTELHVWMLFGGRKADGSMNRDTYLSYDNGISWGKASEGLQLPSVVPSMMMARAAVENHEYSTDISKAWTVKAKSPATRADWTIDGNTLSWQCPYIYLFGGYDAQGNLYDTIWRAAINRLRFAPLI